MADRTKKAGASRSGLISVFLVYILLVILIYYLTGEVLLGTASSSWTINLVLIPAAIILPLTLLIYVLINVRKLLIDRKQHSPGSGFKSKLILFFFLMIILTSIPQTIVSMRFVNTAINNWFSPEIGKAITGGIDLSLEYYNDKIEALSGFSESPVFYRMLAELERSPHRMWINMHNTAPSIDAMQIFDNHSDYTFFRGNPKAALEEVPPLSGGTGGLLPREDRDGIGMLRYITVYETGKSSYSVILSSLLPENLDKTARSLTSAREIFLTYQRNQREFTALLYVFYTFFTIPLILISLLISFLLSDEVIRPIVSLDAATRMVSEGNYAYRILTRSGDELMNLTNSFNMMMTELENSRKKILQTEKITAWQDIARQLAHELRNPLTPIKLSSERLLRKFKSDPDSIGLIIEPAITNIIQEVNSLDALLKEFRDFSRLPAPSPEDIEICNLINEAVDIYKTSYPGIDFVSAFPEDQILISADPKQIKQVFINLIKNSCEAITSGSGKISIQTDLVRKGNSSYCRVRIQDTGSGIEAEKQKEVFNPYFTTKTEGTGLGLSIVERIIFDHRGQIWFESEKDHGTTFFIDLPMEKKFG